MDFSKEIESLLNSSQMNNINFDKVGFQKEFYAKYDKTENVVKSPITDEIFCQDGISYLIKFLNIGKNIKKPIEINKKNFNDPFAPPIKPDMLVSEDFYFNFHRLIFTKFPLFKAQLLLVSRDFISQYTHLTFENFRDSIVLMNLIDGCFFFNGGERSGASQPRKHVQAIPYASMFPRGKPIGIIEKAEDKSAIEKPIFQDDNFSVTYFKFWQRENIKHILIKFGPRLTAALGDLGRVENNGEICKKIYDFGLKQLGLFGDGEKISNDYSFIMTEKFMLIACRKEHDVFISEEDKAKGEIINLNTLAFFGVITSRDSEQIKEIKQKNIIKDIMTKL